MSGRTRTPDEVAGIEAALSAPVFVTEARVSVSFRTDPEAVASLLPPGLRPAGAAVATVTVGRWRSSVVGSFSGGMVYLAAEHDGNPGAYVLAMYMDSDVSVAFGRELFGEPKKLARAGLRVDGDRVRGWVERNGICLMEIEAHLTVDLGPAESRRSTFNVKARSAPDGHGLQEDALLTRTDYTTTSSVRRGGDGTVTLRSSVHDGLGELPILEVLDVSYAVESSTARSAVAEVIPAADFLPFHHGRSDDWRALDTRDVPHARDADDVVDDFLRAYAERDLDGIAGTLHPDVVMLHPGREVDVHGRPDVVAHFGRGISGKFPDRRFLSARRRLRVGDSVVIEHAWTATPSEDVPGIALAGETVTIEILALFVVRDGLLVELVEYG
jgi:acetoacetate decarboxylase